MSFEASLSGINNASKAIDVVSNNLTNANVPGFKAAQAHFSDILAASLAGAPSLQAPGLGAGVTSVVQSFTQGSVTTTSNPLDVAINGQGFFRLSNEGAISYTRNGQFHTLGELDATGKIYTAAEKADQRLVLVNNSGLRVTGYGAEYSTDPKGTIVKSSSPQDIFIDQTMPASASANVTMGVNLDAASELRLDDLGNPLSFDPADVKTYNDATSITTYDADGNPHDLTVYFAKTAPNTWQVYAMLDTEQYPAGELTFDRAGNLDPSSQTFTLNFSGSLPTLALDLTGTTQYGYSFGTNALAQDGYAEGHLLGMTVDAEGVIEASYSNSQTRKAAQLVLAKFANPGGLSGQGGNEWAESAQSGAAKLDTPASMATDSLGLGSLQGYAIEEANVDYGAELVNLIVQQRFYQANAQSIKAQDQLLQTLSSIR